MPENEATDKVSIGPWTIIHDIGEGGMARVSFAERIIDGEKQIAALKTPKAEFLVDARRRKLFRDEIRVAIKMNHPNIVPVIDTGSDDGLPYIAMMFVAGGNLSTVISSATALGLEISTKLAAYVTQQVAYALQYAHTFKIDKVSERIIHRDVAAKNVMISGAGSVQLTDFGVASALSVESSANVLKGTAAYMAPEHAVGKPTQASDCFGLGTILWSLLAGKRFRHDIERDDMLRAAVQGHITPLGRKLPDDIRRVLEGLLHADQSKRMSLTDALLVLESYPSQRRALANLSRRVFGEAATRSGHTRIDAAIPASLLASKEIARTHRRVESDQHPAPDAPLEPERSTVDVEVPAALEAEPPSSAPPMGHAGPMDATIDFGEHYNPAAAQGQREDGAPVVLSHKRRRSSTTPAPSISTTTEPEATPEPEPELPSTPEPPFTPPDAEPVFAKPRKARGGWKTLAMGAGVGVAIIAAASAGSILTARSYENEEPKSTLAERQAPPQERPSQSETRRPLQDPHPNGELVIEAEPPVAVTPEVKVEIEAEPPPEPEPVPESLPDPTPEPEDPPADDAPKPTPSPKAAPKPKVEATLNLGFAQAMKVKFGGKTFELNKSRNSVTVRVSTGKRTLRWQKSDGTWASQSWKLQAGCRHVAMLDATKPRLSTKCPPQK